MMMSLLNLTQYQTGKAFHELEKRGFLEINWKSKFVTANVHIRNRNWTEAPLSPI